MRKLDKWMPDEASSIYWLIIWGLGNKDVIDLVAPILKNRSPDSIMYMTVEMRKQISIIRGHPIGVKPPAKVADLVREASKLPPVKDIETLKPLDLTKVEFIPSLIKGSHPKKRPIEPNWEQRPEGWKPEEKKPISQQEIAKIKSLVETGLNRSLVAPKPFIGGDTRPPEVKEPTLEEVLRIAKKHGAKKVQWRDYIIKFV